MFSIAKVKFHDKRQIGNILQRDANYIYRFYAFRNSDQPFADNGEIGAGSVRAVQFGNSPGRSGRCNKQKTLAGNHQGPPPAFQYHVRRLHSPHPVSTIDEETFVLSPRRGQRRPKIPISATGH